MALIQCKECGESISNEAPICPKCGYSFKENKEQKSQAIGCFIFIIGAIALWLWVSSGNNEIINWQDRDSSAMATVQVERFVKEKLVSPGSARFASIFSGDLAITRDGQIYTIKSHVDSQNRFGATIRTHFIARIEQVSEGEWSLLFLEISE